MDIEIKLDKKYEETKIVIYTKEMNEDISSVIDNISNTQKQILKAYKDDKIYILNQKDIETIYSENGKIYVKCKNELYTVKSRLYELEKNFFKNI